MNRAPIIISVFLLGAGIAISHTALQHIDFASYAINPFGVKQSGYGMLVARLSQDSVNRDWEGGVETGGRHHDHSQCENPDHHHHADEHQHSSSHGSIIEEAHEYLDGLADAKNAWTNPNGMTERLRRQSAKDIASTLRRSYQMDPTNYGVYNAYYLFLTTNALGSDERARMQAKRISEYSIAQAYRQTNNPEAWLTGASAVMNLLFSEQGKRKIAGTTMTEKRMKKYRDQLAGCLSAFAKLMSSREEEGTWKLISEKRRTEMLERARFAGKIYKQLDGTINRMAKSDGSGDARPGKEYVNNTATK